MKFTEAFQVAHNQAVSNARAVDVMLAGKKYGNLYFTKFAGEPHRAGDVHVATVFRTGKVAYARRGDARQLWLF